MSEIWKPVPGYESRYEVSSEGRVRSLAFNHEVGRVEFLRQNPSRGYLGLFLYSPGSKKRFTTHRLVMMAS